MAELQVNILSPAKIVAKTTATLVQAPGVLGYMGILPGHARLISELGVGELTVDGAGGKTSYFIDGGYLDVADDQVTLLVDVVEKVGDIDRSRAEKAKARAQARLAQKTDVDVQRAMSALMRAESRLALSSRQ